MRIAIDASRATVSQRTGTERYSLELIRALLKTTDEHEFLLFFNQPPPPGLLPETGNWRAIAAPRQRLWSHLSLSSAVANTRPDLLFVPAHVLPWRHPARTVVTVHDLGYRFYPWSHPPLSRAYLELSTWWAARRATRIIAVSESTRRDLQRCYGARPERIRVVYEGVEARFMPVRDEAVLRSLRERYGIPPGPYLLSVGTLQPRKNLIGLLRGYRLYADQAERPMPLLLAGREGWGLQSIEAELRRLDLQAHVQRLGYVDDADLPALYSDAFAYCQLSLYEGFGLTVLEAMACGTPVIVSNSSSLPEVVGGTNQRVDPNSPSEFRQAIQALVDSPMLRAQSGRTGRIRAASFSWERCARETLAVLLEAAGS